MQIATRIVTYYYPQQSQPKLKNNKNICNNNTCECNTGCIPEQDYCIPCKPNQIVENDLDEIDPTCSREEKTKQDVCKDCPVGMHPTIDRRMCLDCKNTISTNSIMCIMPNGALSLDCNYKTFANGSMCLLYDGALLQ